MRILISILTGILLTGMLQAQTCACRTEFLWVKSFMEKNHPGYNSDIKDPLQPQYKQFTDDLLKAIDRDRTGKYCIVYLKRYIQYLKDHHSNIIQTGSLPVVENNADSMKAFLESAIYRSTERMPVDSADWMSQFRKLQPDDPQGIYMTPDSIYTIAVIRSQNDHRDYAGVILSSRTKTWEKGQIKIELKRMEESGLEIYTYLRNHSLNYQFSVPAPGQPVIPGWIKVFPLIEHNTQQPISTELVSLKILDATTALVSVRSFGGQHNRVLDSAYKKIVPEIRKYPNLILDVRNNGGGSDLNYYAFMPLLYTDTIHNDFVEMFITADNKKAYERMRDDAKANPDRYGKSGYLSWEFRIKQMEGKAPGSFVPISASNSITTYKVNTGYPNKIAILYNRHCASSCEQLLIDALYSKKVTLVGENSGGYIAYGNVMSIRTPCGNTLNWTTTRKNKDRSYEFVGVPPQVRIPAGEKDWVDYTRRLLQQ